MTVEQSGPTLSRDPALESSRVRQRRAASRCRARVGSSNTPTTRRTRTAPTRAPASKFAERDTDSARVLGPDLFRGASEDSAANHEVNEYIFWRSSRPLPTRPRVPFGGRETSASVQLAQLVKPSVNLLCHHITTLALVTASGVQIPATSRVGQTHVYVGVPRWLGFIVVLLLLGSLPLLAIRFHYVPRAVLPVTQCLAFCKRQCNFCMLPYTKSKCFLIISVYGTGRYLIVLYHRFRELPSDTVLIRLRQKVYCTCTAVPDAYYLLIHILVFHHVMLILYSTRYILYGHSTRFIDTRVINELVSSSE